MVNGIINVYKEKVRFTKQGEFDLFFVVFKVGTGCRDPPLINLFLKIQIDRRKENGTEII